MQPSCAKLRSRVPSLSAFLACVESLTSLTYHVSVIPQNLFSLALPTLQAIGALAELTDALEDDVKAGLRTNSCRCAVRFTLLKSFTPANKRVGVWTLVCRPTPGPPSRKTSTPSLLAAPRSGTPSTSRTPSSCTINSRRITLTSSASLPSSLSLAD